MGRVPCCDKDGVKKGPWTPEEDQLLVQYIQKHGLGCWRSLPKNAGLLRCGKSCRLRWTNYLRPDIKRGPFSPAEEATIVHLHGMLGNNPSKTVSVERSLYGDKPDLGYKRFLLILPDIHELWAYMASQLPGRTDNEIKNFWNTHLKKRLTSIGPKLQISQSSSSSEPINIKCKSPSARHMVQWESARVEAEARLSKQSLLVKPTSTAKSHPDIFLQLWKSEVGETFRIIEGKDGKTCESLVSDTPPAIKNESVFLADTVSPKPFKTNTFIDTTQEQEDTCKPNEDMMTVSDSIGSNEFADSTDTELKLLLDFPGGNDLEFIGEESEFFQLP
ncbi:hypothetical protein POTOM_043583 [Populus tomentosa]|uniref:Uncharacterized protein n=1 Tax=Populus tomentosa TaxID=118781 RepID=A0A8X8CG15_POPTO|nr:hypothetical protein POTOM_043583 [Populus tomentosa]